VSQENTYHIVLVRNLQLWPAGLLGCNLLVHPVNLLPERLGGLWTLELKTVTSQYISPRIQVALERLT